MTATHFEPRPWVVASLLNTAAMSRRMATIHRFHPEKRARWIGHARALLAKEQQYREGKTK